MPPREMLRMAPMSRIALVTTPGQLRAALVEVASSGVVELDAEADEENAAVSALRSLDAPPQPARLTREAADISSLAARGRSDLLAGEAEVARRAAPAVTNSGVSALLGWMPTAAVPDLDRQLRGHGAALVELQRPRWQETPTLLPSGPVSEQLQPLIDLYGPVPYADVNPEHFAAFTYVLMFGMMFADAGHGIVLAASGLWARVSHRPLARSLRRVWLYLVACGLVASAFGAAFGEFFGPSGVIPAFWLHPLQAPLQIIVAALGVGAALLAASYVIGSINRFREGGALAALTSGSGIGGLIMFAGAAIAAGGFAAPSSALLWIGAGTFLAGLMLISAGLYRESLPGAGALPEVTVGAFDSIVRLGSNVISFTRLGAFGLVHAAIGALVWQAAAGLWGRGALAATCAALVFLAGNAIAFALEGLVVGVQALRLEYYELFSRVFVGQGRRFLPWHIPVISEGLAS